MWMIGLLSPPDDAVRASLAARIQRSRQERNIASDTREVRLDRRQKAGLTLIGIWVVIVIVIALVTHRLVALGVARSLSGVGFPVSQLPAPRRSKPQGR